jgi:anti-anti-sigma factor
MISSKYTVDDASLHLLFAEDILSTNADNIAEELNQILMDANLPQWKILVLDMRECYMIDSVGLNVIISVLKLVKKDGKIAEFKISSPAIRRVIQFARLDHLAKMTFCHKKTPVG